MELAGMTQEHPITPPPELVQQWLNAPRYAKSPKDGTFVVQKCHSLSKSEVIALVENAARWGADQELEACCEWFQEFYKTESWVDLDLRTFRAARRPKPATLKEQSLKHLDVMERDGYYLPEILQDLRRALEQLPDNE
jgi:hypothetical protein